MSTENSNLARIPSAFQTPGNFINGLPEVSYADLPDKECSICREDFDTNTTIDDKEIPVKLQCGHIFGNKCLLAFLSIRATRYSCPMCRDKLPHFTDHVYGRNEEYSTFLSWIALHYPHLGANLDREHTVMKAIQQANFYLIAISDCYTGGGFDAIATEYITLMYSIAGLDPQSTTSLQLLEAIQEQLDEVMQRVELQTQSCIPHLRPWVGRKIALANFVLATETPILESDSEDSDLEEGEIPDESLIEIVYGTPDAPGVPIPEHAPIDSSSFPPQIREALHADFEGMSTAEIWNTLRSRRFALNLSCRFAQGDAELLERLAGWLYVDNEIIAEYERDTAFRMRGPIREWHWQLNAAGDTVEYAGEWY